MLNQLRCVFTILYELCLKSIHLFLGLYQESKTLFTFNLIQPVGQLNFRKSRPQTSHTPHAFLT